MLVRFVVGLVAVAAVVSGCSASSEPEAASGGDSQAVPSAAAGAASGGGGLRVDLPIPPGVVDQVVSASHQVVGIVTNPNLSSDEQNEQTAQLATGKLVLVAAEKSTTPVELQPVVVQKFVYMSTDQVQVIVQSGSEELFVTLVPRGDRWLVDDVTSTGCATGSACPFDPEPLLPGEPVKS